MADILHVRDQKTAGTDGGTSSTGVNTRVLNTVVTNTISGASLSTNQVTLPAGTYDVYGSAPAFDANAHRAYLYNITDTAIEIIGQSGTFTGTADTTCNRAEVVGRFTIGAEEVFELRHSVGSGTATNGLGTQTNDGSVEVYAELIFEKVA